MPDSPGLVDSAIGLVNCVFNLPDEQMKSCGQYKLQKNCNLINFFFWARWNDCWAGASKLQLAIWATCETDFLSTANNLLLNGMKRGGTRKKS